MYKVQQCITWVSKNKKRAWEDEPTWKMTMNIKNIYNDRHASKHHKRGLNNYEKTLKISRLNLEHLTSKFNLPSIINCHRR
jgi:hypothetical protein